MTEAGAGCPTCGHLACVCGMTAAHDRDCKFRFASTCAIPIACEPHGRDTCPECDPCTCGAGWGEGAGMSPEMLERAKAL